MRDRLLMLCEVSSVIGQEEEEEEEGGGDRRVRRRNERVHTGGGKSDCVCIERRKQTTEGLKKEGRKSERQGNFE